MLIDQVWNSAMLCRRPSDVAVCCLSFMSSNCWSEVFSWAMQCWPVICTDRVCVAYAPSVHWLFIGVAAVNLLQGWDVYLRVLYRRLMACHWVGDYFVNLGSSCCALSTGCANKKQSPRKNAVFQYGFEPNIQILYVSIHTTYPVNFIQITDTVP